MGVKMIIEVVRLIEKGLVRLRFNLTKPVKEGLIY